MIAVVTGASGFIGSHLVDALIARGATVRVINRARSLAAAPDPRVEPHTVDLLDAVSVRDSPAWTGATHIFHVAGVTQARTLRDFRAGNVVSTTNILAALAARTSPPRLILVSSQAASGPANSAESPVRESDIAHPIEAYGQSKREAELECARYADRVPTVVIRPPSVYGPRDRAFLAAFREALSRVPLFATRRDQRISIIHVRDLISGLIRAAEHPAAPGRTYFMANESAASWVELYAMMADAAGTHWWFDVQLPSGVIQGAALIGDLISAVTGRATLLNRHKAAMTKPKLWVCDPTRAKTELGWQAHELLHADVESRRAKLRALFRRAAHLPRPTTLSFLPLIDA
jgi:nucleoside-diphosphate-sugar epimerase